MRLLCVGDTDRADNHIHYAVHPERNRFIGARHWDAVPERERLTVTLALGPREGNFVVAAGASLTDGLFVLFNHGNGMAQTLRNWGMNGVNQLHPLKTWLTRQAMGHHSTP